MVDTAFSTWRIGATIDGSGSDWIHSVSAGGLCPADPAAALNSLWSKTSWEYRGDGEWVESRDITVEKNLTNATNVTMLAIKQAT